MVCVWGGGGGMQVEKGVGVYVGWERGVYTGWERSWGCMKIGKGVGGVYADWEKSLGGVYRLGKEFRG